MPSVAPRQWRSLEAAAADPEFVRRASAEFPSLARSLAEPTDRRRVLKLMAAAFALGGVSGCDAGAPGGVLIPAVVAPPNIIPALPNYYTTAHVLGGYATGIVVRQFMGRPTKVEGNPAHPASLGATDVFSQAVLLDFYDPDRQAGLTRGNTPSDWASFETMLSATRARYAGNRGAGLRVLTGATTSPTLARQMAALTQQYPEFRWHQWEPASRGAVARGAALAYGRPVETVMHVDKADVILALDSDLISSTPGHLHYARDFAARRNPTRAKMSRVYAVEPTPTLIGAAADHRFIAGPRAMAEIGQALAAAVIQGETPSGAPDWVAKVAADLRSAHGRALVHVGACQSTAVHALAAALNHALDAERACLTAIAPVAMEPTESAHG